MQRILRLLSLLPLGGLTLPAADAIRTGAVADTYAQLCAACHGAQLQGGSAPSMLDDQWLVGGDDASLAKSIREGHPDKGMPAFAATLDDKQIRSLVIYIHEQRAIAARAQTKFNAPKDDVVASSQLHRFTLKTWADGLNEPWSMAFLPDGRALATEKRGTLQLIEDNGRKLTQIRGVPPIDSGGQAGFFGVLPHPDYANNGWIYFSFADPQKHEGRSVTLTRIIRAKLRDGALVDQQDIYKAPLSVYPGPGGIHLGGALAFDRDGYLYFSIGERGHGPNAQNLSVPMGKVHRVHDDGRIPADNPFVNDSSAVPTIWSYGHRNPQGLGINPVDGTLWDVEHGPRGGDELNHVRKGLNYGWPVITYGMNYDGTPMTDLTAKEGMEQPVRHWTPSIAISGMTFYSGDLFPKWKNNVFVGSLAAEELRRVELRDGRYVSQEVLFKNLGRIRNVVTGPDGALYVLLPTRIARLAPAE